MFAGSLTIHTDAAAPAAGLAHHAIGGPVRLSANRADLLARSEGSDTIVVAHGRLCAAAGLGDARLPVAQRILAGWERWGPRLVEEMHGEYAFALWCARTQRLWLARDHLGNYPLFLARIAGRLHFASDLRSLRALAGWSDPDPVAVLDHLLLLPGDPRRSAWRGIERLPAAQLRSYDAAGRVRQQAHSSLAPVGTPARSDHEWVEGFRGHLLRAVAERFDPTDTGAGLSGGLDSSAVAATAIHLAGDARVRLYAVRFPDVPESDEGRHIAAFAESIPAALRELGAPDSPLNCHRRLLPWLDEPMLPQNLHLPCALYAAARADGLHALLDGHDGDSALGRWSSRLAPPAARWWTRVWRRWRRPPPVSLALGLLNPRFARRHAAAARLEAARRQRQTAARDSLAAHLHELGNGLPAYASERLTGIAKAHGIVARHPLYDRELLRWCIAAPVFLKNRDGCTRWLMREALAGLLPESLRWRGDKTSLAPQFHRRFVGLDAGRVDALLREQADALADYVDLTAVRTCWQAYRAAPNDAASVALWAVATLADWLAYAREPLILSSDTASQSLRSSEAANAQAAGRSASLSGYSKA
ncbi:MAG: hypothetical protein IT479_11600 [Xanthomonadales bacterium]|nr:hypothetical protein [Xanthomonadales bacterium]MCC6593906.1 hypothetical protein [Xanthomonadales bacterium]MCE7932738.1 hypothetical protein [Xanthomonadales bacterium PRO6]